MARKTIDGLEIAYELIGEAGAPVVALTPGGRFPMDSGGLPELAQALVAGGKRALLWDRPNCGASDIVFKGPNESEVQARALLGLARELKLGKIALAGGSAGSRVSLIAAMLEPQSISHLVIWWISGGPIGLMQLANHYCGEIATLASIGGMEAVANAPQWKQQIERNPRNRDILLSYDPDDFIEIMQRWAKTYSPSDTSPVPGITASDWSKLTMPVLIFRSGKSDLSHTRRTSEWVHELIPHSKMLEPPWGDDEWNKCMVGQQSGKPLFGSWPKMAPFILEFTAK
jgi:pimeloyl-ACP methyl ester carboxylesterase